MDKLIERIAIFVPLVMAAGLVIWLGSQFITVNKIGNKIYQEQQEQAAAIKSPLSANELAKQFSGSWSYRTEAIEQPDGSIDQREFQYIFTYTPTKFEHGPFRIETRGKETYSGLWRLESADGGKYEPSATGKYNFKLFLSYRKGSEFKDVMNPNVNVEDYDGKTMSMGAGWPPTVQKFTRAGG